jgi:hypothetical protein
MDCLVPSFVRNNWLNKDWNDGMLEDWKSGTPIAIGGKVEALAEIPLRRENVGNLKLKDGKRQKIESLRVF